MSDETAPAPAPSKLSRWLGRSMGVLDAGVSSLGNLATNILAARALALGTYGAFSTTLLIGIITVGLSRSLCGDPLVLLHSADSDQERRHQAERVTRAALMGAVVAAVPLAVLVLLVLLASGVSLTNAVELGIALALVQPALVLQELMRAVAYSGGRPRTAFLNSLSWTVVLVAALAVAHHWFSPVPPAVFILLWGASSLAGAVVGLHQNGVRLGFGGVRDWFSDTRRLSRKLVVDFLLTQVTAEGSVVLISMIAGAAEAGLLRKAQLPLTPVIVLTNGIISIAQPALVRVVAANPPLRTISRMVYTLGGAAAGGSLVLGCLVALVPTRWMSVVVGSDWDRARGLVPILTVYLALGVLGACQGVALRALKRVGQQLRMRYVLTPIALLLVFGTAFGGARTAALGLCASLLCVDIAWAVLLRRTYPRRALETEEAV